MSFTSQLKAFTDKTEKNGNKIFRGTSLSLFGRVVKRTPVLSGRLIGNWQTDVNNPKTVVIERKGVAGALSEIAIETDKAKLGDSIYLTNNLPYAKRIEEGHSSIKAPAGMVRVTLLEFERELKKQARAVK
tara:strand:- start:610 stop:1002 length:393 start_codon:yes stop_codon:yes gene_type:complete